MEEPMTARQKTAAKNGVLPALFTAAFVAWRRMQR
jgi:hypothetical protein